MVAAMAAMWQVLLVPVRARTCFSAIVSWARSSMRYSTER